MKAHRNRWLTALKNGDFLWRTVSHNQRVNHVKKYFHTSCKCRSWTWNSQLFSQHFPRKMRMSRPGSTSPSIVAWQGADTIGHHNFGAKFFWMDAVCNGWFNGIYSWFNGIYSWFTGIYSWFNGIFRCCRNSTHSTHSTIAIAIAQICTVPLTSVSWLWHCSLGMRRPKQRNNHELDIGMISSMYIHILPNICYTAQYIENDQCIHELQIWLRSTEAEHFQTWLPK